MSKAAMSPLPRWTGKKLRVPVPKGRDPFINTPLLSVGPGADGEERFWISTWNGNVGSLGVLVTESGQARTYQFGHWRNNGFYSAVQEDADTLWLCGSLARVARFSLKTGKFQFFDTGAPGALVFQGMVLDQPTGKLFAAAFPPPHIGGFSFDFRKRKPVKVYRDFALSHYMRFSFPNGDGTWSCVLHCPGETLLRWDPRAETTEALLIGKELDTEDLDHGTTYRLIDDEAGRRYFPGRGWFDPARKEFDTSGPQPEREMTWFARHGRQAWGANWTQAMLHIGLWSLDTGKVRDLCAIPDSQLHNVNLTASGKIVSVTTYGEFLRYDGQTGTLEMTRRLDADSWGAVDCVCRITKDRLIGTPFITQRFWEVNLRTGKGFDCGRAAPGCGEVLQTWKIGKMAYMAAYTGGELVEYDPDRHPHFPENPRVVAKPPKALRPVAKADDGRRIFYACSHPYGTVGCVLARYDTRTGQTLYRDDPIPGQQIQSLWYDRKLRMLLGGTTMHADCQSCPATSDHCYLLRADPETLEVQATFPAPAGAQRVIVSGPLRKGRWLAASWGSWEGPRYLAIDPAAPVVPELDKWGALPVVSDIVATSKPGYFVLHIQDRFELWDMDKAAPVKLLYKDFYAYRVWSQDDTVYVAKAKSMVILENCLRGLK